MRVLIGPQGLSYEGTHRSSRPILYGCSQVLKPYPIVIFIGPQDLSYRGTHRFLRSILWRYSQVVKVYPMGVLLGPQSPSYRGTHKSSRAILWAPISTQKLSRFAIDNFYTDNVVITLVTLQRLSGERYRVQLTVHKMSSVSCQRFSRVFRRTQQNSGKIVTLTSCTNCC